MYRLKVISGPGAGKSFQLQPGETTIGRQKGCTIVLASSNVSKNHCAVEFDGEQVKLKDLGSANGSFVNGVLARERTLRVGDRVSIGDVVLELKTMPTEQRRPEKSAQILLDNVVPFSAPSFGRGGQSPFGGGQVGNLALSMPPQALGQPGMMPAPAPSAPPIPTDPKGKLLWNFENWVMPFFYSMNLKQEWKSVCAVVFGGFLVLNLFIAVYPLVESNQKMVMSEAGRRARFIARQLAERNGPALAAGGESRAEIGSIEREEGVSAYIVDLDNRILAPGMRASQYLVSGPEATFAVKMGKRFKAGQETGSTRLTRQGIVISVEPIKAFDSRTSKNVVIAMSVVAVDASLSLPGLGGLSVIFSESFILSVILGALAMFILYRLTLKPFEVLNDDLDRVLRGESSQVTHEFKNEDLNALWDVLRSTVQRLPRTTGGGSAEDGFAAQGLTAQELQPMILLMTSGGGRGAAFCDHERRVLFLTDYFEETSGIRSSESVGQEFTSVARDQAFGSLLKDLFDRVELGGPITEDFEFSGVQYKIQAGAFGTGSARGYLFLLTKEAS